MSKGLLRISIAVALFAMSWGTAQANLLTNGSFEDTSGFVPPSDDTMSLFNGSTTMTGWTVVNGKSGVPANVAWIGPTNPFGLTASNGSYFLDLTGYADSAPFGGVTQSIATTPGTLYSLTFDLGSSSTYGIPDAITASAGSTTETFTSTLTGPNNWESETLDFIASGTGTAITLTGSSGDQYIGLDNVQAAPIPEPATLVIFGTALAGLGFFGRQKKPRNSEDAISACVVSLSAFSSRLILLRPCAVAACSGLGARRLELHRQRSRHARRHHQLR